MMSHVGSFPEPRKASKTWRRLRAFFFDCFVVSGSRTSSRSSA